MKRLALIVCAIAVTATAQAQDATEFKNGGEYRVRYENFLNKSANEPSEREQHADSRLKWNMNIRKGERIQANISLLHNARFGGVSSTPTDATPQTQELYATTDSNGLNVNRAWGWWKATDAVSIKVGRIGIEFADGAVFSENDWQATPYAHEGLNVAFDSSFAMFNLYAVKQAEFGQIDDGTGTAIGLTDQEQNYYLATMDLKNMPEAIKTANVHVVAIQADNTVNAAGTATTGNGQSWQHVGATVGGDVAGFNYKATTAFQFGNAVTNAAGDTKISANMFDVMVGYGLENLMGLKVSAGYHMDSGDSDTAAGDVETYQTLFYDRHNYAGLMDVVEWGNLTYLNLNASIMPSEDLEVGAGFYMFTKSEEADTTNFGDGTTIAATPGTGDDLGTELDIFANKSYGSDMKVGLRYSMFMPGDAINGTSTTDETASQIYLQAALAF